MINTKKYIRRSKFPIEGGSLEQNVEVTPLSKVTMDSSPKIDKLKKELEKLNIAPKRKYITIKF
jgi:hypothetical protein